MDDTFVSWWSAGNVWTVRAAVPRLDNFTQRKFDRCDPVADRHVFVPDRLSVENTDVDWRR